MSKENNKIARHAGIREGIVAGLCVLFILSMLVAGRFESNEPKILEIVAVVWVYLLSILAGIIQGRYRYKKVLKANARHQEQP